MLTRAEHVAAELRRRIVSGELPAGQHLRQDGVAELLGVSRIPVREALLRLGAEGWVLLEPHRGAFVTPMTATEIAELFELRLLLEPHLLECSVPLMDDAAMERAERAALAFERTAAVGPGQGRGGSNRAFFAALYCHAGRSRTRTIVAGLDEQTERYARAHLQMAGTTMRAAEPHRAILDAVKARAVDRARECLVRHLVQTRDELLGWLGQVEASGA